MATSRFGSGALLGTALLCLFAGAGIGSLFSSDGPPPSADDSIELQGDQLAPAAKSGPEPKAMNLGAQDNGMRSVAVASAPAEAISTARIQDAMSRVDTPTILAQGGQAEIDGRVLDDKGQPIEGVDIVAVMDDAARLNTTSRTNTWKGAPEIKSLEESMTVAAEAWAKKNSRRHLARTNANGDFSLNSLPTGTFDVRAYKAEWSIRASGQYDTKTGSTLSFKAKPILELELDVRLVDGSIPGDVVVQGVYDGSATFQAWSPENPVMRFSTPTIDMTVFSGVEGTGYLREDPMANYSSPRTFLELSEVEAGPMVVTLTGVNGIKGTVTWEIEDPENRYSNVVATRVPDPANFDPTLSITSDYTERSRNGEYQFSAMEPGTYAVGLTDWRSSTFLAGAFTMVEVDGTVVTADLHVPAPSSEGKIKLTCRDTEGLPVDLKRVTYVQNSDRSSGSSSLDMKKGLGDTYLLSLDRLNDFDYMDWPSGASVRLLVESENLGSMPVVLRSGQLIVDLTFSTPVALTVEILGYESNKFRSSLSVSLKDGTIEDDGSMASWGTGQSAPKISPTGVIEFPTVAPGVWKVVLTCNYTELDSSFVTLSTSDATVQLRAPKLHEQVIFAPGLNSGESIRLDIVSDTPTYFGHREQLNAEKRVRFTALPAGTYSLQYRGSSGSAAPVEIQVPGPEFVFEPQEPNALKVKIMMEGGTLYKDGFRDGDIITQINDKVLADLDNIQSIFGEFLGGDAEIQVLRGGKTVSLTMTKLDPTQEGQMKMGGTFEPAYTD